MYRVGNKYIGVTCKKTSFSCFFKGLVTFISHIDQRCSINYILLATSGHLIVSQTYNV